MLAPLQEHAVLGFLHTPFSPADAPPAPAVRRAVLRIRDLLARMLRDESRGVGASDADLEALDRVLSRAASARGLVPTIGGYGWGWRRDPGETTRRVFPAVWSTATLLASHDDRTRLKLCDGCDALFFDRSRNRSRRWCDMGSCGNRAKVRAFRRTANGERRTEPR